jgi:hypothetical protein
MLKMPTLLELVIGGMALFIGLSAFGIAICWLVKDPEGKRLQNLQSVSQYTEDYKSTDEKATHKKELGLTETILVLGLLGLIAYIVSRRKRE